MAQWIIYGSNGVAKAKVKELELHDEWMAECFLTVSIKSATPISFAVGDYIDYRGERYTIQYDPNVIKKATSGSYGEGFTYDNIKFVGLQDEVVRCDFNDLVLNDNDMHYSALPTFPFYCESVDDLLDRIQANLEDLYPGQWIVIGLNTVRNSQRGTAVGRAQAFIDAYKQYIDPTGTARTDPYGKQGVAETADKITCWDAMKKVHDDFDLNFIVRGRVIIVGTAGVFTANTFRYGKGNGLNEIERIGESDQRIVTRLRAYGSEENLPAHYYNTVNKQVYATVNEVKGKFGNYGCSLVLDLDFDKKYFSYRDETTPGDSDNPNYIVKVKANDVTIKARVCPYLQTGKTNIYCYYDGTDDDFHEPDASKMAAFVEAIAANDRIDFVDYVNKDAFGEGHYDYATGHLPDNMAVSRLMLPGFPTMSLNAWVQAHKNDADKTWLAQAITDGFTFSTEIYRPYIDSPNKTQYGVRPGSVYFDGSDETENIHPTIEGMTYNDAPIDEVYAADQVDDNGVYPAGEEVKPIKITLPNLGFALDKYYEDGASIDMKNGMCGARSFKMTGKPKQDSNNRWVCEVERVHDDSLDLWFPYCDFQIHGSSEVGHDHGDKYVLTGIDMPDAYIDAAAVKLLQYSIEALKKNHAPRYTYQPKIDNIFMQRQHDTASASQGGVSLHDTLKAGDVFAFADTDLNIDANVIIDILTIRENGDNGIPDYQVTLRDEKQVGTIQKITNKVDSIISGATSINGATGGGLTTRQIQSLIDRYGGEQFLSKLDNDTAQGFITMLKGLQIGANFVPDILGEGGVLRMRQDGKVELVTDILYARMKAYFDSVEIREYQHTGGNRIASVAGNKICRVEYIKVVDNVETIVDDASEADFFRCYFRASDGEDTVRNNWVVGDLAYCHVTSIVNSSDNPEQKGLNQKHLWRLVIGRNTEGTLTEDGEAYIDLSSRATETISGTSYTGYQSGSDVPEAQDDIIQLGNVNDTTRQGAIVEFVTGTDAPSYQIYQGINSFSLNNKNQIGFGYNTSTGRAYMNVYGDTYIGDRNRNTFLEYKQNGAGGNPELNIKAKVQILPNGSTINGESIPDYIKDNQNNYDDSEVQQAISDLNDAVGNLQDQIDGSIETLYGDVDPSVPSNDPYKDYTTDEKEKHLGDMYYNSTTGYAYRYDKSVEEVGGEEVTTYFWQIIRDTGITQAIADAAAALGLAETKAKIFTTTAGTLPTPPYKINDVWVNATYPANGSTYSNEILKCVTARAQGATAKIADWAKASKYTDDSSLQNFISATYDPTIAGLTEQVDRKIESWFQSADPSADWYDDTQTPVLDVRADHVGDMWYSESTHLLKRYDSETTGEGEQAVTTYFWTTIQDQKAIDAYDNAAHAQDTADGKRRVFTAQPIAADAYDVGDLWVNATYPATGTKTYENDVLRCKTAKAAGVAFNISHWQKASKYTDDSALTNFINGDYANTIGVLEGQLDKKAETWYQAADPSSDWYVVDPETEEVTTDTRADHVGDLWYKTSDDTTWYYNRSGAGTEQDPYTYEWKQQNVPLAVFDKIDGKADIFVSKPSTYNKYDMWIIESGLAAADMPTGCQSGDIVIAKNKRTNSYTKGDWEKKDRYTDDSAFNGYINAFLNGTGASGDSATAAAVQKAIAGALGSGTVVDGGLLLSSLIGMRKYKGSGSVTELSSYDTWGGISGEYNDDDETVQGGAKGHGIAAWYGGDMVDKEMLSDADIAIGWGVEKEDHTINYRWARSLFRFDGSGYEADANITWTKEGALTIKNITTLSDSNNNNILNELATFNSAFTFGTSGQGSTTALYITPNVPFQSLYIGTSNANKKEVATQEWVGNNYVSTAFFRQLFRAFKPNATAGQADVEVQPNTIDATISNIKAMVGFWTEQYVSALGNNSDGGGGGASVLYGLNDVTPNASGDGVMGAQDGYVLTYNGSTHHWYAAATAETYVLPQATSGALGGIKIGYSGTGKNYPIVLDTNGKAYVNVPWDNTDSTKLPLSGGKLTNNVAEVLSINSTRSGVAAPAIGFYYNDTRFGGICMTSEGGSLLRFNEDFTTTYTLLDSANSSVSKSGSTLTVKINGTTESLENTNTWRNIYLGGTSKVGTATNTKALNFLAGSNVTIDYAAAGTEEGQSGSDSYFNIKISSSYVDTWRNILLAGTEKLGTATNTKGLNFVQDGKTTITFLAAGTGEGQSGSADYATIKISSSWRGIQNNLTSDSTTDSLSAKQGKALNTNKVAKAGDTMTGNLMVAYANAAIDIKNTTYAVGNNQSINFHTSTSAQDDITMYIRANASNADTDGGASAFNIKNTKGNIFLYPSATTGYLYVAGNILTSSNDGAYIQIGGARIVWDNTNKALKVIQSDNSTAASFYATGAISALGQGVDGGGGGTGDVTWALLASDQDTRQIAISHLNATDGVLDILTGYTTSGKNYAIQKDASGHLFVNVPWSDTTYTLAGLMGSSAKGGTTQPIYWDGTAFKNTTYTLGKSVPSDAVFTDTKNTAGSTNKAATKLFLVGAESQAANPQTYSNVNVYIGTDNCLYSNGSKVLTSHQSLANYVRAYSRSEIGTSPNFDNPTQTLSFFEMRKSTETTGESGTKPFDGFAPFLSLKKENVMMQIAGNNTNGFFIRGKQAASVTLASVAWQKIITSENIGSQSVNYATSAGSATNDSDGNTINTTYLKLSGGSLSGNLTIATTAESSLTLGNTSSGVKGAIYLYAQVSRYTKLTSAATGGSREVVFPNNSGTVALTSDFAKASVNYATSAGNSDTVDSYHGFEFIRKETVTSAFTYVDGKYLTTSGTSIPTTETTDTNWKYTKVSVKVGDRFLIKGRGGSSPRLYAFSDTSSVIKQVAADQQAWEGAYHEIVAGQDGYLVANFNKSYAADLIATSWLSTYTQSVKNITRSGTTFTATRLDGSTFTFTQQDNNTWRNILLSGTEKLGTGTGTKGLNFVGDGKTTITFLAAGTGEGQSGSANYATLKISSTWRGIQNNLTSTSTTDSLSAAQGKALNEAKVAKAGDTMTGLLTANGGVAIASNKTLKIGDIYLAYDSTNNAIEVYKLDGTNHVAANLYATGAISALGQGVDGGGGGGQGDVTWDLLAAAATGGRTIHSSYISGTLANYLPLSGGTMSGTLTLNNAIYLNAKDSGGTARIIAGINAGNDLLLGYGSSSAGYSTYLDGNNIYFRYGTSRTVGMYLNSSGNVGIGTTSPSYKLDVSGTFYASGNSSIGGTLSVSGTSTLGYLSVKNENMQVMDVNSTSTTSGAYTAIAFKHSDTLWGGIKFSAKDGGLQRYTSDFTTYNILDSSNSSVSLSGSTLTVKINGVEKSLTNTNTWRGITDAYNPATADSAISLSQKGAQNLYNAVTKTAARWDWGGSGNYGYCLVAEIDTNAAYINFPINFEFTSRGGSNLTIVTIRFKNQSTVDPAVDVFGTNGDTQFFLYKVEKSKWRLYANSMTDGVWGSVYLTRIVSYLHSRVTVKMENVSSLPTGYITPTYVGYVKYATTSGSCSGNAASATKATQDSDGNAINTTYLKLSGGTMTGSLAIGSGADLYLKAASGSSDSGDMIFQNGSGTEIGRIWLNGGTFCLRYSSSDSSKTIIHSGNYSSYALPLSGGTIASGDFAVFNIQRNHTTNAAAIGFKHYSSGTTVEMMGYIGMNSKNGALKRWDYNTSNEYTILDSSNSSVSKSGSTLTVKINGTSQSITDTNTWRGIQDNLTSSTNTTESLSAKQGYLLANGSARDNTKLPLAGGTMTGNITLSNAVYLYGKNTGGTSYILAGLSGSNDFMLGYGTAGAGYSTYLDGNNIYFRYGSSRTIGMFLNSSGNVGIGTTSPSTKLHVDGRFTAGISNFGYIIDLNRDAVNGTITDTTKAALEIECHASDVRFKTYNTSGTGAAGITINTSQNVGIGTTSPSANLHVVNEAYFAKGAKFNKVCIEVDNSIVGGSARTQEINCYDGGLYLQHNTANNLFICGGGGKVGIGTTSPSYKLHVSGDVYATGGVTCLTSTSSSDIRLKDVQGNVNLNVEQVADAPAIRFLWKKDHSLGMQAGSIAQYWQNVLPETIKEDNEGILSMNYGVAALISAITTARKVVDHEQRITELEKENKELREEISRLKIA